MIKEKLIIGLTGGIGSGKSEVANRFTTYGIEVIDADQLARQLLHSNTAPFTAVINHFGESIRCDDNTINRWKLRQIIAHHKEERQWLERLLHPLIRTMMRDRIQVSHSPYVILVIPLLIENWPHPLVNRVLVVDTDETTQRQRTLQRDHTTVDQINAIMAQQVSQPKRLAHADDRLDNRGSLAELNTKVETLHHYYLTLCQAHPPS